MYDLIKNDDERYNLSWYFPYIDLSDEQKIITTVNGCLKEINGYFFDYVSSDAKYSEILEKIFPNRKKLFWYTGGCVIERKYKRMLIYHHINKSKNSEIALYPACR